MAAGHAVALLQKRAAEVSFDLLRQCVRPLVGDDRADGLSADDLAFAVWASTHGLAMLRVNRQRLPVPTRDKDGDRLTELMVTFVTTARRAASCSTPRPSCRWVPPARRARPTSSAR